MRRLSNESSTSRSKGFPALVVMGGAMVEGDVERRDLEDLIETWVLRQELEVEKRRRDCEMNCLPPGCRDLEKKLVGKTTKDFRRGIIKSHSPLSESN